MFLLLFLLGHFFPVPGVSRVRSILNLWNLEGYVTILISNDFEWFVIW